VLAGAVLAPLLHLLEEYCLTPLGLRPAPHPDLQLLTLSPSRSFLFAFIVVVGLLDPIAEELLFRGAILSWMCKTSSIAGAVVSSLLFAAIHVYPSLMLLTFVAGMAFSFLAVWTRSVYAPIAAHIAFNVVGLSGILISRFH
jgi:membrane protease YdiL (CAAX protease family)